MNNDFTNDPKAYLRELQRIEREQELAKLRTLSLEFAGVLNYFPKLREELEAFHQTDGIAFDGLADRLRSNLKQAADLQFELEHLSPELRNTTEVQAFVRQVFTTMNLQLVERFAAQRKGITHDAQRRLDAERRAREQAEAARLAQEQREREERQKVEREQAEAARQKADAERRAREQAEAARRKLEASIRAATPEMVVIPAGSFIMGCVSGNWLGQGNRDKVEGGGFAAEKPAHQVTVARFAMGKYLVTFAQFDAFCEATGFKKPADAGWGRGDRPVINVSWHDAQTYIKWLCEVTGKAFRLPSEAEWEYAARGGDDQHAYPWGQTADASRANFGSSVGKTTPVGQYPANGFGLHDMHGNVWEWCQDTWHDNYQGAPTTGAVWAGGDTSRRVLRGGTWFLDPLGLRSAYRYSDAPDFRFFNIGFRLVVSPL